MVKQETIIDGWDLLLEAGLKGEPERTGRRLAIWEGLFADWTDEQFGLACIACARSSKFFPTPSELRDAFGGGSETRAIDAWEHVREAIARIGSWSTILAEDLGGDEHALWAMSRIGLDELAEMTVENRAIRAAEFRRLYAVAIEKDYRVSRLCGRLETQNRAMGLPTSDPALMGRPELDTVVPDSLPNPVERMLPAGELGLRKLVELFPGLKREES